MASSLLKLSVRGFSSSSAMSATIKNVTVIGGGLMGSGVAQVAAQSGHKVTLVDVNDQVLKKAKDSISGNLNRVAKKIFKDKPQEEAQKFVSGALANLSTSTDALESAKTADLVLEAIVENIDVKHKLFSSLDAVAPKHTIFASNTSSLSIEEIAKAAPNRKVNTNKRLFLLFGSSIQRHVIYIFLTPRNIKLSKIN